MLERFTKEAREAVVRTQAEARELHHGEITTAHLLLGLFGPHSGSAGRALAAHGLSPDVLRPLVARQSGGLDPDALAAIGIDLDAVREATEATFGPGALDARPGGRRSGHIRFSAEAKKVLELALRQAIRHKQRFICDGHILLGLLMLPGSPAVAALRAAHVDLEALRADVEREVADLAA
ncbi:ClpA/ClpB-like protein [Actinocorallia herbida]|uniref:ClpA/ClpB-like protein n=1 Tax=Actinocorallia herbida TaxID=58109 RepID=A0A3N1DAU7_9ACTN|nr:Clp protease N-terminal domain-containing protein [Actinocorallia herbida]ROO90647.1 ClpA/ClpB-like protein [Actinocorallia herbida]